MPKFRVTVRTVNIDVYDVEADTPYEACDDFLDGEFIFSKFVEADVERVEPA